MRAMSHDALWRRYQIVRFWRGMADAVIASALNEYLRESVRLSPQDRESAQAFISEFFTSPDVDEFTGMHNELLQ